MAKNILILLGVCFLLVGCDNTYNKRKFHNSDFTRKRVDR
jgi:uncharacterized lipoprotein NlpE involved in copper resistance